MIIDKILVAVKVLIAFGALIFVHELGHFLAARKAGVRVEIFSLGFGKKLWAMKRGDTEYIISAFPLGGYVKMAGDELGEGLKGEDYEFYSKPVSKRAGVVVAGPLVNYVVGILLFAAVFMIGAPVATSKIGEVMPGAPAEMAGLMPGDKIIGINGEDVAYFQDIVYIVGKSEGEPLDILFERDGSVLRRTISGDIKDETDAFGKPLKRTIIGVKPSGETEKVSYTFVSAIKESCKQAWFITKMSYKTIWGMLTGKVSVKNVSGPVGIIAMTGQAAQRGFVELLSLMGLISISLAIFNLLPFPILDGGHILFFVLEKLKGRPVDIKVQYAAQQVAMVLLILFLVVVSWNDVVSRFVR